jgi:hypothetical protein
MATDHTREALASAIYPGVTNGAGVPNLHLALHGRVLETIHDVIADCGDNAPELLASNIANALTDPLAAHVATLVAEKDAEIERLGELIGTQVEQCERHCRAAEAERARAWDEGHLVGDPHQRRGDPAKALNPYRADALTEEQS